ncbi:transcriptional regulator [uncultured Thiodictyon sp.]|uniref:helix-turn-helix domain-containing protein n=1 Tax=uncultured Thiodictyon sp. TaxID=1846217 RepID=UPI0025CE29B2|nr:transcriptional regulator [uncultured Thiodictyon sp.]
MNSKSIANDADHQSALAELTALLEGDPPNGSPQAERLEWLSLAIDRYETAHYPIALPDPVDAILFRMEQQGLTRRDLVPYMGSEIKVAEVLTRKRPLSLPMIRKLHRGLGIPADVLIQEPRLFESATA